MMTEAFDRVKSQVGACGIWCGSCAVGNGSLRELSRRFEEVLEGHGLEHWAPSDLDYAAFIAGLATIRGIASCPGCRDSGGRANCEMKACTASHDLSECAECADEGACAHSDVLEHMRSGARSAGLFVKTDNVAASELLSEWIPRLKARWPACVLFMDDPNPGA